MKLGKNGLSKKQLDQIVGVYAKKACNMSATALALNTSRRNLYLWREKFPKLNETMLDVEAMLIDNAESKLLSHINDGDTTCLIFFLKTKGKHRGYIEKQEIEATVNPFEELMKASSASEDSNDK